MPIEYYFDTSPATGSTWHGRVLRSIGGSSPALYAWCNHRHRSIPAAQQCASLAMHLLKDSKDLGERWRYVKTSQVGWYA